MRDNEAPGRRTFFKYMAPATAMKVFTHKTFRYSSPLKFNDPFDIQAGLHFDFNVGQLYVRILDRLESLAKLETLPSLDWNDPWAQVVKVVWENYDTHGFPRQRWLEQLSMREDELNLGREMLATQKKYSEHWKQVLPSMRVFCVSEERDNLLMWAHYAKDHTGIVVELMSLPEIDNPLSVARKIKYQDSPPSFFTEDEWLSDILLQKKLDHSGLNRRFAETKSSHWAYEKEWRVWYPSEVATTNELWVDTPIKPGEVKAIYLGCNASPDFCTNLSSLVNLNFVGVEVFMAEKVEGAYELRYNKI